MKLFVLITMMLSLAPKASMAKENTALETAYDENSSAETLVIADDEILETQLTATHEDLTRAKVVAVINKSSTGSTSQVMRVYVDGTLTYEWFVSTGREHFEKSTSGRSYLTTTPIGYYRPTSVEENHYSKTWNANMPNAVFFIGGVAIHSSPHIDHLGKRASGGCVRLAPENAKTFYDLVNNIGSKEVPKIDRDGAVVLDENCNPVMINTWDALIIVENHS